MKQCDVCGETSDCSWKCSECGKPFDGSESGSNDRSALGSGQ